MKSSILGYYDWTFRIVTRGFNPISIIVLLKLISNSRPSTSTTLLHRMIVLLTNLLHFYPPLNSTLYFVLIIRIINLQWDLFPRIFSFFLQKSSKRISRKKLNLIDPHLASNPNPSQNPSQSLEYSASGADPLGEREQANERAFRKPAIVDPRCSRRIQKLPEYRAASTTLERGGGGGG